MSVTTQFSWHRRASCRGFDARLFYAEHNESASEREQRETLAKQICDDCLVQRDCLESALAAGESWGVWGGLGENERRSILLQQRSSHG